MNMQIHSKINVLRHVLEVYMTKERHGKRVEFGCQVLS